MKNSRFIELLNLYIDHQLTSAEAAELEAEIGRDPERRRTYDQYCRMQKACSVLFEQERSTAPSSRVLDASLYDVERKVVRSSERRVLIGFPSFAAVGVAAAACVAFVALANRAPQATKGAENAVANVARPAQAAPVSVESVASAPVSTPLIASEAPRSNRPTLRESLFAVNNVRPFGTDDSPSELMLDSVSDSVPSYEWMHEIELAPVASLSDRITLQPTNTNYSSRTLVFHRDNQAPAPRVAFQFQR